MALKFSGDFRSLERFEAKLQSASSVLRDVSVNLAEEAIELIREGFENDEAPDGTPWAPLRTVLAGRPLRAGKILEKTGGLKGSWHRSFANRSGFGIASGKDYAKYHQGGTGVYGPKREPIKAKGRALRIPGANGVILVRSVRGTPARKMVPDPGPLPGKWRARFISVADDVLKAHFEGK